MDPIVANFNQSSQKVIFNLKEDLKSIRTGRASSSLVENLLVETYGGQAKLKLLELANIMTEGPSALLVSPFDPSTISDIEKAILKSPLGISPIVQNTKILLKIPTLSQEQREKLIKVINSKIEEKKVIIRNLRDDARRIIKTNFEKKELSEDIKFRLEKDIDTAIHKLMEEIQKIKESKEKEILQV